MTDGGRGGAQLVPRRVLFAVRRGLGRVGALALQRLGAQSRRLQSLSAAGHEALREVAMRWPQLAALLGLAGTSDDGRTRSSPTPARKSDDLADGPREPGSAELRAASLAVLRTSADFAERARAADELGRIVDGETTAALVTALRDSASDVAVHAAEALQIHRGPLAASALRDVLANEDRYFRPETRTAAVRALSAILPIGDAASIGAAVADADAAVSLAAIAALAERDEAHGADALVGVIERADGFYLPVTRHAAARALSKMHGHDPARVRQLAEHEADPEVRTILESIASMS